MKISIQCGQCGKQYQVKPELAGKKVKCQGCGTAITVPADNAAAAKADKPAKKAAAPAAKAKQPAAKAAAPAATAAPAKPAAPPASKAPAPPPANQHSILDEHMADAARLPTAGEMYCPGCKAIIPATAVLCVNCGYDLQSKRSTKVSSEANRPKRKPGQRPMLGVFVAIVSILYGLAGAVVFTLCIVASAIILVKLGLPNDQNGESATAMFGLPVYILLSTAGMLMFVSGIGILRYTKGATLNAGLGGKIYFWMLMLLMIASVGNTIYKSTEAAKAAEAKAKQETAEKKKPAPNVDLGRAQMLTSKEVLGVLRMEVLATIIGIFLMLLGPPAFVWAWAATQGRQWDWELPDPVHKLKPKPAAKGGGPTKTEKE